MSDSDNVDRGEELQFDQVVTTSHGLDAQGRVAVTCSSCRESIATEYYEINGMTVCHRCRHAIEAAAETPQGLAPLVTALLCGFGAGVAGAFIYFAVIYFAHLEIGIVAVLIGYMVGYTVRKGAGGRGGRRFQVLAVLLTYASIALAYTPLAVMSAAKASSQAQAAAKPVAGTPPSSTGSPAQGRRPPSGVIVIAMLLAFIAALPVFVVVGSFPTGLISGIIMFIGMRQAWMMTGAPVLNTFGPYQVGPAPVSGSV